jgi:hypothetical protein
MSTRSGHLVAASALVASLAGLGAAGHAWAQPAQEAALPLTPPARFITDVEESEALQVLVEESIASTFVSGVRNLDWQRAAAALSPDLRARFPRPEDGIVIEDDKLRIRKYDGTDLDVLDRAGFLDGLRAHVSSWTSVERASWHVFEFLAEPDRQRAYLKAHLELGGPESGGARSVLNATVVVEAVVASEDRWLIERLELAEGMRVENPAPPFRDITDAVGLHFNSSEANQQLRQEILNTRTSLIDSGLNVVDWNRDGFWDIVATKSWEHSVVFVNDGKGGFVRESLGFQGRRLIPSQVLVVDLDNDGMDELVSNRVLYRGANASMAIHTRRNGAWVALSRALEFETVPGLEETEALSMTAADVNGDGLIDLFVAAYENNQSRDPSRFNNVNATDGSDNLLFINHGGLRFTEESDARGITGTQYTYVAQFFDLDQDDDVDLVEGNDYGKNVVWDNQGDGTFRALPDHPLARDPNFTMGFSIADWDNTGQWSLYISNMYSHAGNRVVRLAEASMSDEMHAQIKLLAEGNQLFTLDQGLGPAADQAHSLAVNDGGWAWGSVFCDIDNDGDKELFVANGNASFVDPEAPDF